MHTTLEFTFHNKSVKSNMFHDCFFFLSGLNEYTTYSVFVAANNSFGIGPYSQPVQVKTYESSKFIVGCCTVLAIMKCCSIQSQNCSSAILYSIYKHFTCQSVKKTVLIVMFLVVIWKRVTCNGLEEALQRHKRSGLSQCV